jgi:hypothetical protein
MKCDGDWVRLAFNVFGANPRRRVTRPEATRNWLVATSIRARDCVDWPPMVFCDNTSRKEPTSLNTALATSRPSRQGSTTAPERPSAGKQRPKLSTII